MTTDSADAAVVVLTALETEYDAVRVLLRDLRLHPHPAGTIFEVGGLDGTPGAVALAVTGVGNQSVAVLTERAITEFRPLAVLFVGIAGALHDDLALGTIVVATKVYGYHGGTEVTGGFRARPQAWDADHGLEQLAREVSRNESWKRLFLDTQTPPTVHFRPIAAGGVVLNSRDTPLAEQLRRHHDDAAAIEMESAGIAKAAHLNRAPYLTIRGISDKADGEKYDTDGKRWRPVAAANAAAFAMAVAQSVLMGTPASNQTPRGRGVTTVPPPQPSLPQPPLPSSSPDPSEPGEHRGLVGADAERRRGRSAIKAWVTAAGTGTGRGLRWSTPPRLVRLLSASTLAPIMAARLGAPQGAVGAAILAQLGAAGSGYLTAVLDRVILRFSKKSDSTSTPVPVSVDKIRDVLAEELRDQLDAGGEDAAALRGDLAEVLRSVDGVQTALVAAAETGATQFLEELTRAFVELSLEFSEFAWMRNDVQQSLLSLQQELTRQGVEQRHHDDLAGRFAPTPAVNAANGANIANDTEPSEGPAPKAMPRLGDYSTIPPAAFMSYVRFDDQHDRGQLSELRDRLSAEVRAQTGQQFHIFQDRTDIAWGQNWQARINDTLDAVTMLIPIITPSFFHSQPCRDEVTRFLERERKLGRDDLILPIYYISTPKIDDLPTRQADELAQVLAARQYVDWRELRFKPFTSQVVRKTLTQLARRLHDVQQNLSRPLQATQPPTPADQLFRSLANRIREAATGTRYRTAGTLAQQMAAAKLLTPSATAKLTALCELAARIAEDITPWEIARLRPLVGPDVTAAVQAVEHDRHEHGRWEARLQAHIALVRRIAKDQRRAEALRPWVVAAELLPVVWATRHVTEEELESLRTLPGGVCANQYDQRREIPPPAMLHGNTELVGVARSVAACTALRCPACPLTRQASRSPAERLMADRDGASAASWLRDLRRSGRENRTRVRDLRNDWMHAGQPRQQRDLDAAILAEREGLAKLGIMVAGIELAGLLAVVFERITGHAPADPLTPIEQAIEATLG